MSVSFRTRLTGFPHFKNLNAKSFVVNPIVNINFTIRENTVHTSMVMLTITFVLRIPHISQCNKSHQYLSAISSTWLVHYGTTAILVLG